jgi:hypothetical protein
LHSGTETGIKRIVLHRGSAFAKDPPRSSPEAEPRLLKKTQLKENIPSYLQAVGQESNYWPVISAIEQLQCVCFPIHPQKAADGWGTVDSRYKCNSASSRLGRRWQKEAMEKMENKEHFPLFHGTAAAIFMNLFTVFVALVL